MERKEHIRKQADMLEAEINSTIDTKVGKINILCGNRIEVNIDWREVTPLKEKHLMINKIIKAKKITEKKFEKLLNSF